VKREMLQVLKKPVFASLTSGFWLFSAIPDAEKNSEFCGIARLTVGPVLIPCLPYFHLTPAQENKPMTEIDAVTETVSATVEALLSQGRSEADVTDALFANACVIGHRVLGDEKLSVHLRALADRHLASAAATNVKGSEPTQNERTHAILMNTTISLVLDGQTQEEASRAMALFAIIACGKQMGASAVEDWLQTVIALIRRGPEKGTAH
jgi:hypothetical protein